MGKICRAIVDIEKIGLALFNDPTNRNLG